MITLSAPVTTEIAASQSGWCEIYDIYLKSAITTPWGSTSILRLADLPGGLTFFTPKLSPEAIANQGVSQAYNAWPIARSLVKSDSKFTADTMQITASNVSTDWAAMIAAIDWYDTPIIIRKVPTSIASVTADDCAVLWSGMVDSCRITDKTVVLSCSSDLASLNITAPRENMHTNCRFSWADFQCTQIRFRTTNYKSKTCAAGSSATVVKSAGLTEDVSDGTTYGTDLVNPLANAAITASSEGANWVNQAVTVTIQDAFTAGYIQWHLTNHLLSNNDPIQFTATSMPPNLSAGVTYYARRKSASTFNISATPDGSPLDAGGSGSGILLSTVGSLKASAVKSGNVGYWKLGSAADWGTLTQGFYQIPDAQAGLKNELLTPYIQFDFGAAKTPTLWRIASVPGVRLEELVRLLVFFSATNAGFTTGVKHETYIEIPSVGGVLYEIQIPTAATSRYWRIAVRTRWAQQLFWALLSKVYAYESSRHFWQAGRITFDAATATVALRGISRRVRESYNGSVVVPALPVAPAAGDTFIIERGCPRTFNACCTRQNWENFGGFLDLPFQAVIRS